MVLPSFFFNKSLHFPIMFGFLGLLLALIIYVLIFLNRDADEYDEHGNSRTNQAIYYYNLNENILLKQIPFILGLSIEFNNFPLRSTEKDELNNLWELCKPNIPKLKGQIPFANKKAITLMYAWLKREKIENVSINNDMKNLQLNLYEILPRFKAFAYTINMLKKQNKRIKSFGYNCIKSIIEISQCLNQRLWFNSSPYIQFPYITDKEIYDTNRKMKKNFINFDKFLNDFNNTEKKEFIKNIKPEISEEKIQEIVDIANVIPRYSIYTKVFVDGYEEILKNDIITIEIEIIRRVGERDSTLYAEADKTDLIGFGHSTYSENNINEKLVLLLNDDNEKLLENMEIEVTNWKHKLRFQFQATEVNILNLLIKLYIFTF